MGRVNSRDKGKRGEREVAELLRAYGFEGRRGQQYHGGPDSPDVVGLPGWHIEVKFTDRLDLPSALAQCQDEAKDGESAVIFHRRTRTPWLVVLDAEQFLRMIRDGR